MRDPYFYSFRCGDRVIRKSGSTALGTVLDCYRYTVRVQWDNMVTTIDPRRLLAATPEHVAKRQDKMLHVKHCKARSTCS